MEVHRSYATFLLASWEHCHHNTIMLDSQTGLLSTPATADIIIILQVDFSRVFFNLVWTYFVYSTLFPSVSVFIFFKLYLFVKKQIQAYYII